MSHTKAHIVESIHSELNVTKNKSVQIVENLLELIKDSLASGALKNISAQFLLGG